MFYRDLAEDLRKPHLWAIYWFTRAKLALRQWRSR